MRTPGDARRRILLYFFLGIALPSGFLAYLALRGIRNDEALLDRERRERHTRIARAAVARVEQRLRSLAVSLAGWSTARSSSWDTLVQAAFVVVGDTITFRTPHLSYLAETTGEGTSRVDPALFAAARNAEHRRRYREAAGQYQRIAREFGRARTVGGLPVGPSARLELAGVHAAAGDTAEAGRILRDLYRTLLEGEVPLSRSEFDFFVGQVRDHAARYGRSQELATPIAEEAEARRRTEALLTFARIAAQRLPERLTPASDTTPDRRIVLEGEGRSFHLLMYSPASGGWRGVLLEPQVLAAEVSRALALEAGDTSRWMLRGVNHQPLAASNTPPGGAALVTTGFAGGFPPWVLELHETNPSLLRSVFAPGRRVYLFAFVLLAGILLFGLTLTARVVSRELELARMKSDFVATVSHEFRSPLTAIRQLAAMLGSGRVPSEERRQQYHRVLLQQSERLSHLVENVLESARMDNRQGSLTLAPVDVRALVEEVTATAQERVAHQGFQVVAEVDGSLPPARLDRETIARALGNLIDNAIKYSGDSRNVLVRGFRDHAHLVLSVRDWGAGLHQNEQDKIFERFYRGGDEMTRSTGGSGLGLSLVKRIVEAHGGEVRVESALGQGSTFTIHLPFATPV